MKPPSIGRSYSGAAGPQLDPEDQSPSSTSPSSSSSSPSSSKYKGVRKRKWGKWVSEIRLPNSRERIWLGSYDSAEKAARAFDAALFCLRGRNAKFNFPNSPPDIPGAHNLTPQEIQGVAARFANEHPGGPEDGTGADEEPHPQGSGGSSMDWSFLGALDENDRRVSDFGFLYGYGEIDYMNGSHQLPLHPPPVSMDGNVRDRHEEDNHDDDDDGGGGGGDCDGNYTYQSSFLWNF